MSLEFATIVQIRTQSTRLKNKVFLKIGEKPLIEHVVKRLMKSHLSQDVIVATSTNPHDDVIERWCKKNKVLCYRGSEEDVLNRFVMAAQYYKVENVIRACGDNPFIDFTFLDTLITSHEKCGADISNAFGSLVIGATAFEVIKTSVLVNIEKGADQKVYREHVTTYIYNNPEKFTINSLEAPEYLRRTPFRLTIDEADDLELCRQLYTEISRGGDFAYTSEEIISYLSKMPKIAKINSKVQQKDWKKELKEEH
ncbi:MAG: NTP transferase domain-containing protein [Nitrospinae bacterium]|nr:NTP transferase domain-containing protein [Nitrospinota bacterium]